VSTTILQAPSDAVLDVRPGDDDAATAVEAWLDEYATSRDPELRQRIILAYLGLADRLAGRYRHSRGSTPEDLTQTARAGLIAAIDRYNPNHGTPFVPYAVACMVGELKRHLRDTSWRLHVPRPLKERALRLCEAADELHQRLSRSPTTTELAAAGAREEPEDLLALSGMLAALPRLEREVIVLRFFQDLDQYEIAARVGFSQMHVSRLQRRALARMRAQLMEP
jgi:RNA polymerase sigma-B factor